MLLYNALTLRGQCASMFKVSPLRSLIVASALASQTVLPMLAYAKATTPVTLAPPNAGPRWSKHLFNRGVFQDLFDSLAGEEALVSVPPPLAPAPGAAMPWQPRFDVYGGTANLATGNLSLSNTISEWTANGGGVQFALVYNSQGAAGSVLGPKWTHSYAMSVSGVSPANVTYPDGTVQRFALSGTTYTAPAGILEKLVHNANGSWVLQFKTGASWNFDLNGRLSSLKDANNNATTLTYASGLLTNVRDAFNRPLTIAYTNGKIASVTDFESRVWTLDYNSAGRLQTVSDPTLSGVSPFTTYSYDANGNVIGQTNRLGKTWSYSYGTNGVFSSTTDPSGNTAGTVTIATQSSDQQSFSSNVQSQSANQTTTPDTIAATYPVDTVAQVYVEDPSGTAAEYGLDAQGRVTAVRNGTGAQTNFTNNASNRHTQFIEPDGATANMAYDGNGNMTSLTDASNRTVTQTYNTNNSLLSLNNGNGSQATYTFDANRNMTSATDPTGKTSSISYNSDGTVSSVTDPAGKVKNFSYSTNGRVSSVTNAMSDQTAYTYIGNRMSSRTDGLGRVTNYVYDDWGRLVQVNYPLGQSKSATFDTEGHVLQTVDVTGTRTYTYDNRGLKTGQTDPRGNTSATYDAAGRLTSQSDASGRLIQYSYDGAGRLSQIGDSSNWTAYTYDTRGRTAAITYSSGVKSDYTFDAAGRIATLVHKYVSNNSVIASYSATYDNGGRITEMNGPVTGTKTTYTYDLASRVLTEKRTGSNVYESTFTYDNRGLRKTALLSEGGVVSQNSTYSYDDAGRPTQVVDTATNSTVNGTYNWNADGTLQSYPGPGYRRKCEYNPDGRLTKIYKDYGNGTVTLAYEYAYGFDGMRRWRKDYAANTWDWYPCGVMCGAGELVTQRSDLTGQTWQTNAQQLGRSALPSIRNGMSQLPDAKGSISTVVAQNGTQYNGQVDGMGNRRGGNVSQVTPYGKFQDGDEGTSWDGSGPQLNKVNFKMMISEEQCRNECMTNWGICVAVASALYATAVAVIIALNAAAVSACTLLVFGAPFCIALATSVMMDNLATATGTYLAAVLACTMMKNKCLEGCTPQDPGKPRPWPPILIAYPIRADQQASTAR